MIYQSFHAIFLTLMKNPIVLSLSHSLDSNRVIYQLNVGFFLKPNHVFLIYWNSRNIRKIIKNSNCWYSSILKWNWSVICILHMEITWKQYNYFRLIPTFKLTLLCLLHYTILFLFVGTILIVNFTLCYFGAFCYTEKKPDIFL